MKEINYKDMKFNPFNLIGGEWMLVTAGDEASCNTMTASWGHLGCLWGHNDPTAVIYLRPSRYTKKFVDEEGYFSLCVMDKSFKKQMAYLGSVSGRDEDKIGKAGLTPVYADNTVYFEEAKLVLVCKKLYQSELQESGFLYQETIDENYPQRDFHTMYVGKIEKVLVRHPHCPWHPAFFSLYRKECETAPFCVVGENPYGSSYEQCVPFIGNEHLAHTIDPAPAYYGFK